MIVGCGKCGTRFEVPGPGRVSCPACGTANEIAAGPPGGPEPAPAPAPAGPPPAPAAPPRRMTCPACGFSFLVGEVAEAPCPNCREIVTVEEA